jgi:flagellar motor switch/type III secretory pathway protein FliN
MKKTTFKKCLFLFVFLCSISVMDAQKKQTFGLDDSDHRNCGLEKHEQEMLNNPEYAASFYERQAVFQEKLQEIHSQKMNGTYQKKATLYIPVAVHFEVGTEADRACLEAYAQTQIDVINEDYTFTNPDGANWAAASAFYPGLTPGSTDVKFCIATQNHPAGADPEVLEGSPLVTIGANGSNFPAGFPETDATYSGYMNFIIKDIGAGLLGYSPLGGSIAAGGAVVMNTICYGTGAGCAGIATPNAPYNLGRTVTHELGHFYNLNHTFIADGGTNCGPADGDGIADTPKVAGSTYGNPANGSVPGCVGGEFSLTMNYMDYVNDASMYMFTPDQMTVVEAYFATQTFASNKVDCSGPNFNINSASLGNCGADSATSIVNFVTENGFTENTTFTVTGVPAPATYSFSPGSLSADGSTTLTVSGLLGVTEGVYPITITATSTSITRDIGVNLSVGTNPCSSVANTLWGTSTTRVLFEAIDNVTAKPAGYNDYTATSTDVYVGDTYPLSANVNTDGDWPVGTVAWIDWNQNCTFDANEEYILGDAQNVANGLTSLSPLDVTVPLDAVLGSTTMRVSTKFNAYAIPCDDNGADPTADVFDGEVEDYTVNVLSTLGVDDNSFENLSLYPNPTNGTLNIAFNTTKNVTVGLFDIRGRSVYSNSYEVSGSRFNQSIELGNLSSGIYVIKIKSGLTSVVKKIVVN